MLRMILVKNGKPSTLMNHIDVKKIEDENTFIWVDVVNPKDNDYNFLQRNFHIHPLTIEDMKSDNPLPKVDIVDKKYIFLIFHAIFYEKDKKIIGLNEINFCLGKNFIITFHNEGIEKIEEYRKRIINQNIIIKHGPENIMHNIIDIEVDTFNKIIDDLDTELDQLEDNLFSGKTENTLRKLSEHRKEISQIRKIIVPERDLINKISHGEFPFIREDILIYFRDIYDHIYKFSLNIDSHRELIGSIFETYSSIQVNSMGQVSKQLTVIATIFLPLTFITGIYGTNFVNIPEIQNEYSYFILLICLFVIGISMFFWLDKKYKKI